MFYEFGVHPAYYDSTPRIFDMCRKLVLLILCSLIAFVDGKSATPSELIFPIYAFTNTENCRFWSSGVSLFNPNAAPAAVTFSGFDKDGNLIESRSLSINPFTASGFSIVRTNVHWLKVASSDS